MPYNLVVSPKPVAELQVKPLEQSPENASDGLLFSPKDGSVFERCSFRLNPIAVFKVLRLYGYQGLIAYDTPGGFGYSFNSKLIVTKKVYPSLIAELNKGLNIPDIQFYKWNGQSVNTYDFNRRIIARLLRFLIKLQFQLFRGYDVGRKNLRKLKNRWEEE